MDFVDDENSVGEPKQPKEAKLDVHSREHRLVHRADSVGGEHGAAGGAEPRSGSRPVVVRLPDVRRLFWLVVVPKPCHAVHELRIFTSAEPHKIVVSVAAVKRVARRHGREGHVHAVVTLLTPLLGENPSGFGLAFPHRRFYDHESRWDVVVEEGLLYGPCFINHLLGLP